MRRTTIRPKLLAAAAVLVVVPIAAHATSITAAQIFGQYNVVAESNVSSTNDIEGDAVIGGNLNGGPTFFNNSSRLPANASAFVYGTVNVNTNIDDGGTLYYGAIAGGVNVNLNGGAHDQQGGFPNQLSDYVDPLVAMSLQLAKQAQQGGNTTSVASNTLTFNANAGDANGIAYFDFTTVALEALLSSASTLKVSLGAGVTSVVINVTGAGAGNSYSFTSPSGLNVSSALQGVLFNFYDDTSLTLDSWETSVLAPDADTQTSNAFEGFLFTDTLDAGGELHNLPYNGNLPPPVGVPEPSTVLLVAAALAALGVRRAAA